MVQKIIAGGRKYAAAGCVCPAVTRHDPAGILFTLSQQAQSDQALLGLPGQSLDMMSPRMSWATASQPTTVVIFDLRRRGATHSGGAARLDGRRALQWSDQAAFQRLGGTRPARSRGLPSPLMQADSPLECRLYATAAALDNLVSEVDAWEAFLLEWKDANRLLCYHLTERYSTAVLRGLSFRQALCLPARRARSPRSAHLPPARIARSNITR